MIMNIIELKEQESKVITRPKIYMYKETPDDNPPLIIVRLAHEIICHQLGLVPFSRTPNMNSEYRELKPTRNIKNKREFCHVLRVGDYKHDMSVFIAIT